MTSICVASFKNQMRLRNPGWRKVSADLFHDSDAQTAASLAEPRLIGFRLASFSSKDPIPCSSPDLLSIELKSGSARPMLRFRPRLCRHNQRPNNFLCVQQLHRRTVFRNKGPELRVVFVHVIEREPERAHQHLLIVPNDMTPEMQVSSFARTVASFCVFQTDAIVSSNPTDKTHQDHQADVPQ